MFLLGVFIDIPFAFTSHSAPHSVVLCNSIWRTSVGLLSTYRTCHHDLNFPQHIWGRKSRHGSKCHSHGGDKHSHSREKILAEEISTLTAEGRPVFFFYICSPSSLIGSSNGCPRDWGPFAPIPSPPFQEALAALSLSGPQLSSDRELQELNPSSGSCDPLCLVDETGSEECKARYRPKTYLLKAIAVFAAAGTGAVAIYHSWVAANQDVAMALLFGIGYVSIIFEESLAFNKSGVGLLMAVSLWVVRSVGAPSTDIAVSELQHAFAEVSEIVFFLLGAMTIVEIVDSHQGFKLVTDNITTRKPRTLLWVVGFVTFLLSSILDNLTSTIFMVSLLRKLVPRSEFRKLLGAVVVIAANAGGAWTPIGDVTTTMLWIHGQISTLETMKTLFIPSAVSVAVPLALMSLTSGVSGEGPDTSDVMASERMAPRGQLVFSVGVGALVFVPVFKAVTGLPPYMGMLLGLGVLWILTDAIHHGESERHKLKVPQALSRIDTQAALFFLGILLSVSSLEAAGILRELANYLDAHIPNVELIAISIGVVSAIIDNVPLVAATMGMYDLTTFPQDSEFWQLVAYCASTGGSMLVIGSAAGVAFMGMEKMDFFWYLRKVSGFALAGYAAGFAAYLAVQSLHISLPTTVAQVPFISGS